MTLPYQPGRGGGGGSGVDQTARDAAAAAQATANNNTAKTAGGVFPTLIASLTPATTSAAPTAQRLNLYDATSGNLTPPLPLANSVAAGTVIGFKKTDATTNLLTPTCSGSDHIGSTTGSTSIPIRTQDQITWLSSDGTSVWSKVDGELSLPSLDGRFITSLTHGSTGATARPASAARVYWLGSVAPTNAVQYDRWIDTSAATIVERVNTAASGQTWQALGGATRQVVSVAYAATVTPAVGTADQILNVGTLTGNITIANPTGTPADGQALRLRLAQDGTGNRTVTFGNAYAFGTDVTAAMIPTAANGSAEVLFAWHAGLSVWRCIGLVRF